MTSFGYCRDCQNVYSAGWEPCEQIYYSSVIRGSTQLAFCNYCWFSYNLQYCDSCVSTKNCFGNIGLHHKQFCILNKQYTESDYHATVPKLIEHMKITGEWGEFFPPQLSPFAYNETAAHVFMPLRQTQAEAQGWRWRKQNKQEYQPASLTTIPDHLNDVSDTIVQELLACLNCKKIIVWSTPN